MKLLRISLAVLTGLLFMPGFSQAEDVDSVLARAKKDGKVVMLELGSVGCIPCEKMKPVMEKLRVTYNDRLEVFFVDISRDGAVGRRFGVHFLPTQVFIDKAGKEFHRHVGFYAYDEIVPVLKTQGL